MKAKELELVFHPRLLTGDRNAKAELMEALKNNFSLRSVKGKVRGDGAAPNDDGNELFIDEDQDRLAFYAERNERLSEWIDNPSKVSREVWPEALVLAQKAGRGSLFSSLRALSGSGVGSVRGKRKSKSSNQL